MSHQRPTYYPMLVAAILGLILASPLGAAKPQVVKTNWDNLKRLAPDQKIRVSLKDGSSYRGLIQKVTDDAIVVRMATGDETLTRQSIRQVSARREGRSRAQGAAFGASAGLLMGPLGSGAGALAGAIFTKGGWQVVYRAP